MRWFGVSLAVVAAVLPGAAGGGREQAQVRMRVIATGFESPVYVGAPRSEPNRLYVVEKPGVIRVLVNGKLRSEPFLDIRSRVGDDDSEQGLLSVAFHPNYATNHRFFVDYTDNRGDTRVVEFRSNGTVGLPEHRAPDPLRQPALLEPQRRPAPVRPRREALRGHGRRRLRGRSPTTTRRT